MLARLTDVRVRTAKPAAKPYKLYDGGALFLLIKPSGAKLWRYRYRIRGAENLFALGAYPDIGLQQARELHAAARKLVAQEIHPSVQKRADSLIAASAAANTFEAVAREWIQENRDNWTPYYLGQVETMLQQYVFGVIGGMPIKSVASAHLLSIVKKVASKGDSGRPAPTVAILIRQWCSAIFRYAAATLRADTDPAGALRGAIKRPKVKHKHALRVKEIGLLSQQLEEAGGTEEVRIALKLLLLTFVRPGELRAARWSEFDLEAAEWHIPAERMKMREPHTVPLSRQALELLRRLQQIAIGRPQVFPNVRDPKRIMSPTTLNRFLERMGYAGKFSAHGCRATASTVLNEMSYRPEVIERQLAHRERNTVRASYNHASYMTERRKMMQEWADFVDAQRDATSNVIPLRAGSA